VSHADTGRMPPIVPHVVRLGPWSVRLWPRGVVFAAVTVVCVLGVGAASLAIGGLDMSATELWAALTGEGDASAVRSIRGRRLPRLLTAIGVGGSLGVSGAVFQSLSRNVLGSPDVIGFTTGAAAAAAVQIVVFDGGVLATALAAVVGGVLTALLVYGLARRDGVTGGLRLILVGIGTAAVLGALIDFLMVRASITDAAVLQQWSAGSLTGRGWSHALIVLIVDILVVPVMVLVSRRVSLMEMGDDTAASLGIPVERFRFAAVVLAVLLAAVATAAAGPIAFVALAAPQIARRTVRSPGVPVVTSFLTGAFLLATADLLAQRVEIGLRTPVGMVTNLLGGAYLVWLLARRA